MTKFKTQFSPLCCSSLKPFDGSACSIRVRLRPSRPAVSRHHHTSSLLRPHGITASDPDLCETILNLLNRLWTGTGRCTAFIQKWRHSEDGDEQTMKYLLACPNLPEPCTHEDLEEFNPEISTVSSIGPRESGLAGVV